MKSIAFAISILIVISCKNTPDDNSTFSGQDDARTFFANNEKEALAKPYAGIFTGDTTYTNLFPIRSTGISTESIFTAASQFVEKLDTTERQKVMFGIEDDEWRKWCNVDNGIYDRQGISLKEMNLEQKSSAWKLLEESLSPKGLQLSKDIMKTDQTLKELNNGSADYDEELYFMTLMGEPSRTTPWGWQLDGHHLIINYFVLGDQVVMSPVFMGAEPVFTTSGKYKGNTLFQDEQNLGMAVLHSLTPEQQAHAIISAEKSGFNMKAGASTDNLILPFEGVCASTFNEGQKTALLILIEQYVNNLREGHQEIRMEEIKTHLDETWFAWIGEDSPEAVFYYRIHSPVILIEFDHQTPVGVPYNAKDKPSRDHIHTLVRIPNGNDYGKDLLRQHLQEHHQ